MYTKLPIGPIPSQQLQQGAWLPAPLLLPMLCYAVLCFEKCCAVLCCAVPCRAVLTSRFLTTVVPSASAASSRMRLERLLEPGSFTVPLMVLIGSTVNCSTTGGVIGGGGSGR